MKKRFLAAALAALLLAGCSANPDPAENTIDPPSISSTSTTTTPKVNFVEEQPENTTSNTEETTPPEEDDPAAFPVPYPTGRVDDPEMLDKLKAVVQTAVVAESVLDGEYTIIPLGVGVGDGYRLIPADYAADLDSLIERMYEGCKYTFWHDQYGWEIEDKLTELVKETEEGIALFYGAAEQPYTIDVSNAVLASLTDEEATLVALGTLGDSYIWRTYELLNGERGWVVQAHSEESVTGDMALFSELLIGSHSTLDMIFGNVTPITDENGDRSIQLVTIEDDPYGHGFYNCLEIEPFMTVAEMRQFLRDTFTSEIAESYISLYVNRTYVEKEGRLYIISGSILPRMGEFSLANYENRSISTYDVTSLVEWTDGEDTYTIPVTIAFRDGKWKSDTRLPMMKDRVIN